MSFMSELKTKVNYEAQVARCGSCKSYVDYSVKLTTNSDTVQRHAYCNRFGFTCNKHGVCDFWTHKQSGETLAAGDREPPEAATKKRFAG